MAIILDGTAGIANNATDLSYTGTLTGGTGVVNLGSGQVYKDASGNVGIGTNSPATYGGKLSVVSASSTQATVMVQNPGFGTAHLGFAAGGSSVKLYNCYATGLLGGGSGIDIDSSGNLLVGTTTLSSGAGGICLIKNGSGSSGQITIAKLADGATNNAMAFFAGGSVVGTVSISNTATSYNTSSDYRLKNTIAPMTGALAKVALLKPVIYKWNADNSDGQGFIAHELAEVEPGCVTGKKDAVDAEGKPQYQGIDTSFLVATLTAAIQEQQALIQSLTTRITALEAK